MSAYLDQDTIRSLIRDIDEQRLDWIGCIEYSLR